MKYVTKVDNEKIEETKIINHYPENSLSNQNYHSSFSNNEKEELKMKEMTIQK